MRRARSKVEIRRAMGMVDQHWNLWRSSHSLQRQEKKKGHWKKHKHSGQGAPEGSEAET